MRLWRTGPQADTASGAGAETPGFLAELKAIGRSLIPRTVAYRDRLRLMAVETRMHDGLVDVTIRALRQLGLPPSEIIRMVL